MNGAVRKLKGRVLGIERTGEFMEIHGEHWEKCIFLLELTSFSKRTPDETLTHALEGRKIKLVRYCFFDWHYKLGVEKTLEPDETEAVLRGTPQRTVYW
jgi:hypothetical protein